MKDVRDPATPIAHELVPEPLGPEPLTVLVLAGEAVAAEVVPLVRAAGFEPIEARPENGGALAAGLAAAPALIVAEVRDGAATALRIASRLRRACGATAPAVLAIVEGDEEMFERAYAFGAVDVLARPVSPSLLRVKVARHARRRAPAVVGGYRIERTLGRGAMGTVYLASRSLDARSEPVALKVLEPGAGGPDPEALARFRRECEALRALAAPGVPRFLEAGRDGDRFFCAMEYVAGETLATAIQRGPLTDREVARIVDEVGEALEEIHAIGLVHRDVKPANVIRGRDLRLRLVDFGLARAKDDCALTKTNDVLGTISYMAPELVRGEPIDPAVDAFALGMTAFEAALGGSPLEGSGFAIASRLARGDVPRPGERLAGVADELVQVLEGLLAPDRRERLPLAAARARIRSIRED